VSPFGVVYRRGDVVVELPSEPTERRVSTRSGTTPDSNVAEEIVADGALPSNIEVIDVAIPLTVSDRLF
jgi:hypothetical protein